MQTVETRPMNRQEDRCDKCRAQAFVMAEKGPMALLFCGHHGKQYKQSLELQGWGLLDFTDEIG
jgi:hypothetical protein